MKRKTQPKEEVVVVPPEILPPDTLGADAPNSVAIGSGTKVYTVQERPVNLVPCVVCGAETNSEAEEKLCWVCRRLKISAWRDSELVPAQE